MKTPTGGKSPRAIGRAGEIPAPTVKVRMGEDLQAAEFGCRVFSRRPFTCWDDMVDEKAQEREYMRMALALAARGKGMTHPNPMVGAVVVKDDRVVGKGYHKGPYTPHAEVEALAQAGDAAKGSDLYVTLEPCNHQGRTPPCTEAIIRAGVRRVTIAAKDPNPHVRGGGAERLVEAGVEVRTGLMEREARRLNEAYEKLVLSGRPLVVVKMAATADGKVALRTGASRWITGEESRREVHRMRRGSDAVMVGRGTVEEDDPELTVRMVSLGGARPPVRVVVDSRLSLPEDRRLARGGEPKVMVASIPGHDRRKGERLRARGVEVLEVAEKEGRVDLGELLRLLGGMGVARLLVEGGPTLVGSLLEEGLADRLALFLAPRVLGDREARAWMEGRTLLDLEEAIPLRWRRVRRMGEDLLLEAEIGRR